MKTLLRIAAVLSFVFFFAGGCQLLGIASPGRSGETALAIAMGLFFIGTAFFVGPILLVAAERFGRKDEGR
jgi:D-arabinose 5-phosphate isomerase GutQ